MTRNEEASKKMRDIAKTVQSMLPKEFGFAVLVFEFSDKPGEEMHWVSNAQRDDMIRAMQEFVRRQAN